MEENVKQIITIVNGKTLSVNSVMDIVGFDDGIIILNTKNGKITIEGSELKIDSLEKSGGNLFVKGLISGVYYSDDTKESKGFFRNLFKK